MIALKSNDFPVPVSVPTINASATVVQCMDCPDYDERTRTCGSRKEHILPFFHDELKHAALLFAKLGDGCCLVGATGGTERDAWVEEGIDFWLFGRMIERFIEAIGVVSIIRLALLDVTGDRLEWLLARRHR